MLCVVCVCSKIRDDEFSFFLFFCFLSKVLVRRPFSLVVVCIFLDPPPKISAPIILHNGFLMTPYETLMYYSFER